MIGVCRVCGAPTYPDHRALGRCQACYFHWWRYGTERPRERPWCVICGWPVHAQHLCRAHYQAAWMRGLVGRRYRGAPAVRESA